MQKQGQQQTGTRDETYDIIAVLYHALQGAEKCETYAQDAQGGQLRDFFQQALQLQRQIAEQGKHVLHQCLQQDRGPESAFDWDRNGGAGQSSGQTGLSLRETSGIGDAANPAQQSFADESGSV